MKEIEVAAKKVDDAINQGLILLNTTIDNVTIDIISQGGLFRKAKIKMTLIESEKNNKDDKKSFVKSESFKPDKITVPMPKPDINAIKNIKKDNEVKKTEHKANNNSKNEMKKSVDSKLEMKRELKPSVEISSSVNKAPQNKLQISQVKENSQEILREVPKEAVDTVNSFLNGLFTHMKIEVKVITEVQNGEINVSLDSDNACVIGYRGETLDAIEYLTSITLNKNREDYIRVNVDSCSYREKREAVLKSLALKMANKCIKTGRKVILDPMNNTSRKVIHAALSDNDKVITKSEGKEPNRYVVIYYKREKKN